MGHATATLSITLATVLTALTAGCEARPDRLPGSSPDEDFSDGRIYVQPVDHNNCDYDDAQGGIVFDFYIIGHKDANVVAEIQQPQPGRYDDAGPVVASTTAKIRNGSYESPMTLLVPFDKATWETNRDEYRCVLQTDNLDN